MIIKQVGLKQFRNYTETSFDLDDQLTIITGANGVGKTNILEAIHLLLNGNSWRDHERDLVQFDQEWWRIDGQIDGDNRSLSYKLEAPAVKQVSLGGSPWRRFNKARRLPVVLFEPDQLNMIHGSKGTRRRFIDEMITGLEPSYTTLLARYERVLRQRNNLLKEHRFSSKLDDLLFAWDISLAQYGAEIINKRQERVDSLNLGLSELYSSLSGQKETLTVVYKPSFKLNGDNQSRLAKLLKTKLEDDRLRGFTSVGPHRDDIGFVLNSQPAESSASRGEIRSLVYGLKRRELELVEASTDIKPVFLMDDLFSELDEMRQKNIAARLSNQTIITTTASLPGLKAKQIKL